MTRPRLPSLVGVLLALTAPAVAAHPLAPSLLELRELDDGATAVVWKTPSARPTGVAVDPVLPPGCKPFEPPQVTELPDAYVSRWKTDCGHLVGETISVTGLRENAASVILRVVLADGRSVQSLLTPGDSAFVVPGDNSPLKVFHAYVRLGIEHLLFGFDHLLFLLGLVMLTPARRRIVATITSFTAGHSVTLSLATLGIVAVPPGPIEVGIAASIMILAAEIPNTDDRSQSLLRRRPWLIAFTFGLLHGLGFAGALAAVGLPHDEIPLSLFGFNVGIEVAQLAFVLVALALARSLRTSRIALPRMLADAPAYGIGTLAAYWCFQRAAALWS